MRITAEQFKQAIDLLEKFRTDFQFDKQDPGYLGFLNVGVDILDEEDVPTWLLICDRQMIFRPILHELGLDIEGPDAPLFGYPLMNKDETVFVLATC